MTRRARLLWSASAAAGLTVALIAGMFWSLGRPSASSGTPLSEIRSAATPAPGATSQVPRDTGAGSDAESGSAAPTVAPATAGSSAPTGPAIAPPVVRDADPEAVAAALAPAAAPTRVEVASLGVDAVVDRVGVEPDGSMTVPRSASRVGWYGYGSAPGDDAGNTVLAGHVATAADGPGALVRLREAEVGTRIVVTDAAGTRREYEVAGKEIIVKTALPVEDIFARDGLPLLIIVTCGGEFRPELRSYTDNVVVTAVPVAGGA